MDSLELDEIKYCIEVLQKQPNLDKLEGKKFIVYRVGTIIRVDIKQ